jgi:hypothetical protein
MTEKKVIYVPCEPGQISDGFHTFDELYDHRCLLFIALANHIKINAWKSKKHDDDTSLDGWFIVGITLSSGAITYHIPVKYWELCHFETKKKAPKWDGHTSHDVIDRLKSFIETTNSNTVVPF